MQFCHPCSFVETEDDGEGEGVGVGVGVEVEWAEAEELTGGYVSWVENRFFRYFVVPIAFSSCANS